MWFFGVLVISLIRISADMAGSTGITGDTICMQGSDANLGKSGMAIAAVRSGIVRNVVGRFGTQCWSPRDRREMALTAFVRRGKMARDFSCCKDAIVAARARSSRVVLEPSRKPGGETMAIVTLIHTLDRT